MYTSKDSVISFICIKTQTSNKQNITEKIKIPDDSTTRKKVKIKTETVINYLLLAI